MSGDARSRRLLAATLVPHTRVGRHLALTALIDSCGTGMFLSGSAMYLTREVGLTSAQVGVGLSLAGLIGFVSAVPLGMLADRHGAGRVFIALQLWRGLCFGLYSLVSSFGGFVVLASAIATADTAVPPISQAVIGAAMPDGDRLETMAKVRAVRNVGYGVGALAATVVIQADSRAGYLALVLGNMVSFLIAAALLTSIGVTRLAPRTPASARVRRSVVGDARYLAAALLTGVLSIHMTMLTVGLPLWIATRAPVPPAMIGILVIVNTAMTVALQARLAGGSRELEGAVRALLRAGVALAGFGVVTMALGQVASPAVGICLAVVAVALLTFGELWHSAGGWTVSYELADPERRARYLSTFQLGTALQAIAGPWVVTHLVLPADEGWLVFAAVVLTAGALVSVAVPVHGRRPAPSAA